MIHTIYAMKSFSKLFFILFVLCPVFTGCNWEKSPVQGSYNLVQKKIMIADYSEIEVNFPAEVVYQQYSDSFPYLQISTDDNMLEHLNIRVEDDRLIVEIKPDSIISPTKLLIYTASTSLKKVNQNSSGNIRLAGEINSLDLTMELTGAGEIRTDSLLCDKLRVDMTGSGKIILVGAAGQSVLSVNGSGQIDDTNYFCEDIIRS